MEGTEGGDQEHCTNEEFRKWIQNGIDEQIEKISKCLEFIKEITIENLPSLVGRKICMVEYDLEDIEKYVKLIIKKIYFDYLGKSSLSLPMEYK